MIKNKTVQITFGDKTVGCEINNHFINGHYYCALYPDGNIYICDSSKTPILIVCSHRMDIDFSLSFAFKSNKFSYEVDLSSMEYIIDSSCIGKYVALKSNNYVLNQRGLIITYISKAGEKLALNNGFNYRFDSIYKIFKDKEEHDKFFEDYDSIRELEHKMLKEIGIAKSNLAKKWNKFDVKYSGAIL
jgi:hypothetical protein